MESRAKMMVMAANLLATSLLTAGSISAATPLDAINAHLAAAKAAAKVDFKGTLGVSKEVPVGFKDIRLKFELESNANDDQLASLAKLTERYCVVYQTLINGVGVETKFLN